MTVCSIMRKYHNYFQYNKIIYILNICIHVSFCYTRSTTLGFQNYWCHKPNVESMVLVIRDYYNEVTTVNFVNKA